MASYLPKDPKQPKINVKPNGQLTDSTIQKEEVRIYSYALFRMKIELTDYKGISFGAHGRAVFFTQIAAKLLILIYSMIIMIQGNLDLPVLWNQYKVVQWEK